MSVGSRCRLARSQKIGRISVSYLVALGAMSVGPAESRDACGETPLDSAPKRLSHAENEGHNRGATLVTPHQEP